MRKRIQYRAFTLVEMLMVVMIVGMVASMAVPRISQGARSAYGATLDADLSVVRKAIILYAAEHGGEFPGPTAEAAIDQLTKYTSRTGAASKIRGPGYEYGPYLIAIPPVPVGANKGSPAILIDNVNSPPVPDSSGGEGWLYNPTTGEFYANVGGIDQGGTTLTEPAKIEGGEVEAIK